MSNPDAWGVTAGSDDLKQHAEVTTKEELEQVFSKTSGIVTGVVAGTPCTAVGKAMQ